MSNTPIEDAWQEALKQLSLAPDQVKNARRFFFLGVVAMRHALSKAFQEDELISVQIARMGNIIVKTGEEIADFEKELKQQTETI